MFRIPLRAISSATQCASRMSNRTVQPQQLSARVAPSSSERVKQPVQELQTSQSTRVDGVSSPSPVRQAVDGKPTRTEQLVWLAKQSFAASVSSKSASATTREIKKDTTSRGKREEPQHPKFYTEAWDVPTVWAHLW